MVRWEICEWGSLSPRVENVVLTKIHHPSWNFSLSLTHTHTTSSTHSLTHPFNWMKLISCLHEININLVDKQWRFVKKGGGGMVKSRIHQAYPAHSYRPCFHMYTGSWFFFYNKHTFIPLGRDHKNFQGRRPPPTPCTKLKWRCSTLFSTHRGRILLELQPT
jgi:hypothetical protein